MKVFKIATVILIATMLIMVGIFTKMPISKVRKYINM